MTVLFLIYFDIEDTTQIGVAKKINSQIRAMRRIGHSVSLAYCKDDMLIIDNLDSHNRIPAPSGKSHYRKSLMNALPKIIENYDLLYVRYPGSIDYYLYETFKRIKNKGVKVVLEMPTYPIGGEMIDILNKFKMEKKYVQLILRCGIYGIHRVLSRQLSNILTCIVCYSQYEEIWGTKVINIENGIECDTIKIQEKIPADNNELRIIFVAVFAVWHGLDRLISGINEYYKNKTEELPDIKLTLIGQSDELERVKNTDEYRKASSHVRALGAKYGSELELEYNKADIAVSSLGMHRIGLKQGSTLKTREYCAKGIPFIYGYKELGIGDSFKYAMRVPASEDPIDLVRVLQFYEKIRNMDYSHEMHKFSMRYDWTSQMRILFDQLSKLEE